MTTLVFLSLAVGQEKKKNSMSSPPNLFLHQNKNYPESDKLHSLSRNLSDTDTGYRLGAISSFKQSEAALRAFKVPPYITGYMKYQFE